MAWASTQVASPMDLNNSLKSYHWIQLATLLKLPVVAKEEPSGQAVDLAILLLLLGQFLVVQIVWSSLAFLYASSSPYISFLSLLSFAFRLLVISVFAIARMTEVDLSTLVPTASSGSLLLLSGSVVLFPSWSLCHAF